MEHASLTTIAHDAIRLNRVCLCDDEATAESRPMISRGTSTMPYFYDITNVPPLVPDSRSNSVKTARQMMHIVELIPRLIGETYVPSRMRNFRLVREPTNETRRCSCEKNISRENCSLAEKRVARTRLRGVGSF